MGVRQQDQIDNRQLTRPERASCQTLWADCAGAGAGAYSSKECRVCKNVEPIKTDQNGGMPEPSRGDTVGIPRCGVRNARWRQNRPARLRQKAAYGASAKLI